MLFQYKMKQFSEVKKFEIFQNFISSFHSFISKLPRSAMLVINSLSLKECMVSLRCSVEQMESCTRHSNKSIPPTSHLFFPQPQISFFFTPL